ncbi:MAG: acetyl-CoA carboxylase biotin carboxyl carrier protein, partial [Hyphomicrobiaceae bacterium]
MTAKTSDSKGSAEREMIRELAELLNETGLSEIEIEKSGLRIRVARQLAISNVAAPVAAAPAAAPASAGTPAAAPAADANDP